MQQGEPEGFQIFQKNICGPGYHKGKYVMAQQFFWQTFMVLHINLSFLIKACL